MVQILISTVLKALFFIIYPLLVNVIHLHDDRLWGHQISQALSQQSLGEAPDRKSHFTFEDYFDAQREQITETGIQSLHEFSADDEAYWDSYFQRVWQFVQLKTWEIQILVVLSLSFFVLRKIASNVTKKQPDLVTVIDNRLIQQLFEFEEKLFGNGKLESFVRDLVEDILSLALKDIYSENREASKILLSNYRLLNDQFRSSIRSIEELYDEMNSKIQLLNLNYESKIELLVKSFENLRLDNDEYLKKIRELRKIIDELQEEPNETNDTEISQPMVKSIDELKHLI